jgi:hypothetical protein
MSEKSQIDVRQGNKVVCIYSGWGTPRNILPALRAAASAGHSKPLDIAHEIVRQVPDASFGLRIIGKDCDPDDLSYRYTVDVTSTPWRVRQTRMQHLKVIDNGDGTGCVDPNLIPAVTRSFRIGHPAPILGLDRSGTPRSAATIGITPNDNRTTDDLATPQKEMMDTVPKLIESKDYKSIARLAASLGAFYLEEELNNGVSDEQVSFTPEMHLYKDGKLIGLAVLDVKTQDDVDRFIVATFEKEPTMVVVLVQGMWMSTTAVKSGGRASQQSDRVNAGVGTVYLAGNIVAQVGKPVFANAVA